MTCFSWQGIQLLLHLFSFAIESQCPTLVKRPNDVIELVRNMSATIESRRISTINDQGGQSLRGLPNHKFWDLSQLEAKDLPSNGLISVNDVVRLGVVHDNSNGCLHGIKIGHSVLSWSGANRGQLGSALKGLTIWVNEHMQIGHAQYDLHVLQMLSSQKVDRIVLQRAPCFPKSEYCLGKGTWLKFFEGMYAAMIDATQPGIPIYIRFEPTNEFTPHYLSISDHDVVDQFRPHTGSINIMGESQCFERVIWRDGKGCPLCFYDHMVGPLAVEKFKTSAYKLLNSGDKKETEVKPIVSLVLKQTSSIESTTAVNYPTASVDNSTTSDNLHNGSGVNNIGGSNSGGSDSGRSDTNHTNFHWAATNTNKPIVITFAYRSPIGSVRGRLMTNFQSLIDLLSDQFPPPLYAFRPYPTPDYFSNATYVDDIRIMSETHVLIAEHGAYQTNVIYMRRGSLLIDLAGSYWLPANSGQSQLITEKVANTFGVFCKHVYVSGLVNHETSSYNLSKGEMKEVGELIKEYIEQVLLQTQYN